ncbi:hypothetical protein G7046_g1788 [Stylonectria norvegica]|nr:hypothetical protein G7046_g1788 [Stylonectria norvegica]
MLARVQAKVGWRTGQSHLGGDAIPARVPIMAGFGIDDDDGDFITGFQDWELGSVDLVVGWCWWPGAAHSRTSFAGAGVVVEAWVTSVSQDDANSAPDFIRKSTSGDFY